VVGRRTPIDPKWINFGEIALRDGEFLYVGGLSSTLNTSAEVYNTTYNQFRSAGNMNVAREFFMISYQYSTGGGQDNQIMVAGGYSFYPNNIASTEVIVRKPVGQTCASDSECLYGFCYDGVCCGQPCTAVCQSCNEPGNAGLCITVTGAPRPGHGTCPGSLDGSSCAATCPGGGSQVCTYPSSGSCAVPNGTGACNGGRCGEPTSCTSPFLDCDTSAYPDGCEVNKNTDANNCTGCGIVCDNGHSNGRACNTTTCTYSGCVAGWADCNTAAPNANGCETSTSTITNCAGCGNACDSTHSVGAGCNGTTCTYGSCVAGWADCNTTAPDTNGCETSTTTTANCAGCGNVCDTTHSTGAGCNGTTCTYTGCASGWGNCNTAAPDVNGCETDITTVANCGSCGNACSTNHDTPSCVSGACQIACGAGWGNCDGQVGTGCETDVTTVSNCGTCGHACSTNHATPSCVSGACQVSCAPGWGNCDNDPTNGCEIDLTTVSNCGGCGNVCSTNHDTPSCVSGACQVACATGWGNCDGQASTGCETATTANGNCGACGVTCSPSDSCHTASCQPVAGNGACANVDTSACATPFCSLGTGCGTWHDSDGDGLSDAWESAGYVDMNCNGVNDGPSVDLPLPGANPSAKDIYVRYDYMANAQHSHQPPDAALAQVAQAFAAQGITLHWIAPTGSIAHHQVTTLDSNAASSCAGTDFVTTSSLRASSLCGAGHPCLSGALNPAYHYMMFVHDSTTPGDGTLAANCPIDALCGGHPLATATGVADIGGDDAVISFGHNVDSGVAIGIELWSSTIMHELGHNFGLVHGSLAHPGNSAAECLNYLPNYLSVMNYDYELNTIVPASAAGGTTPIACNVDADCAPPTQTSGPCATANACHCTDDLGAGANVCYRVDYSGGATPA
jgi:hypothetical protein